MPTMLQRIHRFEDEVDNVAGQRDLAFARFVERFSATWPPPDVGEADEGAPFIGGRRGRRR